MLQGILLAYPLILTQTITYTYRIFSTLPSNYLLYFCHTNYNFEEINSK